MKLFDPGDPDKEVAPGAVGHIGGRGAALMLGYLGNQTATEGSFNSDGWFLSGDLGVMDAKGNLRIEGRLKDLIIRGGHNIYPSRVAAFPVADDRLGERVCIAVSGMVEVADLMDHLRSEGLSKYDMPEYFLRVGEFPLTASGKILKRELVLQVQRNQLHPQQIGTTPSSRSA